MTAAAAADTATEMLGTIQSTYITTVTYFYHRLTKMPIIGAATLHFSSNSPTLPDITHRDINIY